LSPGPVTFHAALILSFWAAAMKSLVLRLSVSASSKTEQKSCSVHCSSLMLVVECQRFKQLNYSQSSIFINITNAAKHTSQLTAPRSTIEWSPLRISWNSSTRRFWQCIDTHIKRIQGPSASFPNKTKNCGKIIP